MLDKRCGIAGDNRTGFHVAHHYRASCNNCLISDVYIGAHECIGANPDVISDGDASLDKWELWLAIIVSARTKVSALRNRCGHADRHQPEIVDNRSVTNSRVFPNSQIPRNLDQDRRMKTDLAIDFCSKQTKHKGTPDP